MLKVTGSIVSAFVATGIAATSVWGANAATSVASLPKAEVTAAGFRTSVPQTYKSWAAQLDAEKMCVSNTLSAAQWEDCLVGHYEAKTSYRLNEVEYVLKRTASSKTWKVSYSKITLPKGGKALTKAQKVSKKLPTTVYFKAYTLANGSLVLGSNGSSYDYSK